MSNPFGWLERIGIIFNFAAGFLIAPELIGLETLRRWEKNLQNSLRTVAGWFDRALNRLQSPWELLDTRAGAIVLGVVSVVVFLYIQIIRNSDIAAWLSRYPAMYWGWVALFFLACFWYAWKRLQMYRNMTAEIDRGLEVARTDRLIEHEQELMDIRKEIGQLRIKFLALCFLFLTGMFFIAIGGLLLQVLIAGSAPFLLLWLVLYLPPRGVLWFVSFLVSKLEGNDRLKKILVTLGIVLLIVGNLFQFLGTWS